MLSPYLDRVRHAFLIGEAAPRFHAMLDGKVACTLSGTLDRAFEAAVDRAPFGQGGASTILLAPACASFDQFPSFEARGDAFKALVEGFGCSPALAARGAGGGG